MEKTNGHHSRDVVIPKIIVTDYDAELANQQHIKPETKETNESVHGNDNSPSPPTVLNGSTEEDRNIVDSLILAHQNNSDHTVDVVVEQIIVNGKNPNNSDHTVDVVVEQNVVNGKNPNNSDHTVDVVVEQNVVNGKNSNRSVHHVDVDANLASNVAQSESTKEKSIPETDLKGTEKTDESKGNKELPMDCATDDALADLEVSNITSLLESKNKFVPLPSVTLNLQRPSAQFVPVPPPPGVLPDISYVSQRRRVPLSVENILGHFPPLGKVSFPASLFRDDSETSNPSSDEKPPDYWKTRNSSDDGGGGAMSKDEIREILNTFQIVEQDGGTWDINAPTTSKNLEKSKSLAKQSKDRNKK